jgi:hypothetical protein
MARKWSIGKKMARKWQYGATGGESMHRLPFQSEIAATGSGTNALNVSSLVGMIK